MRATHGRMALFAFLPFGIAACGDLLLEASGDVAAEVIYGDVVIRSLPSSGHVAVLVDGSARRGSTDGTVDEVFVLQREHFLAPVSPRLHRNVEVRAAPGFLDIGDDDGEAVAAFALHGSALGLARAPSTTLHTGYGLARRTAGSGLRLSEALDSDLTDFLPTCRRPPVRAPGLFFDGPVDDPLTCNSGGPNSSSCSTSCNVLSEPKSCSVQCVAGSYACCDMSQCKCQQP